MAAMNISEKRFQELMEEGKAVLVDYWAPWCGYCRRIAPAYDRIADQFSGDLEIVKINIDEAMELARREQIEVIPTLVLYQNGKALASVVAPESKAAIEEFIRENLK